MYEFKLGIFIYLLTKQLFVLAASVIKIITLSRLLYGSFLIVRIMLRKHQLQHKSNVYLIIRHPPLCWRIPINHACHISGLFRSKIVTVSFSCTTFKWAVKKQWIMSAMNWKLPLLTYCVFIEKDVFSIYISIATILYKFTR